MKRFFAMAAGLVACITLFAGCTGRPIGPGWVTLIDGGKGLENWNQIGDANWRVEGNAIVADRGSRGFLVSKNSYKDFVIYAEFWAESTTNSGIFIRAAKPQDIGADSSYEVNIWDNRPDPVYGTGAIVNFAKVPSPPVYKAGGRWNTLEVSASGSNITVRFNGEITASIVDGRHAAGPFALQFGPGVKGALAGPIKWRSVQVRQL